MPWRCPFCSTPIDYHPADTVPRPGTVYRCSVCRLELIVDEAASRMTVAPLDTHSEPPKKLRKKKR